MNEDVRNSDSLALDPQLTDASRLCLIETPDPQEMDEGTPETLVGAPLAGE